MTLRHPFALAQARLAARFAALPDAAEWQRLAASRTFAAYVEDARGGPMEPWLKGISAVSEAHQVERALRAAFMDQVEETALWLPAAWRGAVLWTGWLPYLPLFAARAGGAPWPAWVAGDYRLGSLLDADGDLTPEARGSLAALVSVADPAAIPAAWSDAWHRRWPAVHGAARRHLVDLGGRVARHLAAFPGLPPGRTWEARAGLRERLRLGFHQRSLEPAAAFLYLALVLLDLERLRAGLLGRRLFDAAD
jgi:hypothetical protein